MIPALSILERLRKTTLSCVSPFFPTASATIRLLVLSLWFLALTCHAHAGQVTLAWDANTEIELGGYKLYFGQTSRNYMASVDVGNYTAYSLDGLEAGRTYYFAVTAYDQFGQNESEPSKEVQATIPFSPVVASFSPAAATMLPAPAF